MMIHRNLLKEPEGKRHITSKKQKSGWNETSYLNKAIKKTVDKLLKERKKKLVNLEFYTQWKYLFKSR